ncbi:polyphenol oxidase I, chloroplastic-like [Panicum virgatum]|uniref:Tyrosinase copper-binding domain-containing protein n=1 Tax=Panicum virgatum TaxID=38727 RepID=A0A8T0S260_PANVG|nr:polyphenol oxidase I, chloroplastic-like [Panicum virgatum]KAG2592000.1 hypothetical protein PVAP13_5NG518800 [Panicum virgatum]
MAAGGGSNRALLALRALLLCALAAAAATALLPLATGPCARSLSRSILAATGLDPYLLSCAGDASGGAPLLSQPGANGTGSGAIVTDQRCVRGKFPPDALPPLQCCPPASASAPVNFTLPDPAEPLRTRRPVHAVGAEYMAKYARAVALMKALPRSDPRSFYQQANVHCAYCTGAHRQAGRPDLGVQIHFSWLFFPFHRAYLYFFERIAAKLLGEPGFALPVWTWDVPEGMGIPEAFADEVSPLYDPIREPSHAPPKVADLDFFLGEGGEKNLTDEQQILHNFRVMYKQMISGATLPSLFLGQPYRAGDPEMPGPGTVEWVPHNTMHTWTGDNSRPNAENMGVYYSAGRDPIFYPHHANIDRLWESWRGIVGGGRRRRAAFADPDWLDSSFLLYDEEARLVRITVRDVLDIDKLRYTYAGVGLPWLNARPPVTPGVNPRGAPLASVSFPVSLDAAVTAEVRRPPPSARRRRSLQEEEEVLVVEGIEADAADFVRFDVYVNAREYRKVPPGGREMAGTFAALKHPGKEGTVVRTSMTVALGERLEDLGAGGDDSVTVTLVPVRGKVRIGGLKIVYMAE